MSKRLTALLGTTLLAVAVYQPCRAALVPGNEITAFFEHSALGTMQWSQMEQAMAADMPVWFRVFSTDATLAQTGRNLAEHKAYFQHMAWLDQRIIMSGIHDHIHWLADFSSVGSHVSGYVSALPFQRQLQAEKSSVVPGSDTVSRISVALQTWVSHNARQIMAYTSPDQASRQFVFQLSLVPEPLSLSVAKALRSNGWQPDERTRQGDSTVHWQRGAERLWVSVQKVAQHSMLYLHHLL